MKMKPLMEGWRKYLAEGQTGTAFEDVVVAVARGEDPGPRGELKHGGSTFNDLAIQSLSKMGLKPGGDPSARKVVAKGISGDPKTDIVLDGKNISLKLPGPIQFTSGEAKSSAAAMELAYRDFLKNHPDVEPKLKQDLKKFLKDLMKTSGKGYLPRGAEGEGYLPQLKKKAVDDWSKNRWASGTQIPSNIRKQGKPQDVFPNVNDYVKEFVKAASRSARKQARIPRLSYEEFNKEVMSDLKKKIKELSDVNEDYYNIIVDEWLTGRRQFSSNPELIATHMLSPDGFYDISTTDKTAQMARERKDFIKWDVRAKGRNYLAKKITLRVGFDAKKYYKSLQKTLDTAEI